MSNEKKASWKEFLASLTAREAKLIRERFGSDLSEDPDLEEIGRQFEVTRKRIREIEARAMRKRRSGNSDPDETA